MIETTSEILAHQAGEDAAKAFVAYRKKMKKPLTERAAVLIAAHLIDIRGSGGSPAEALDMAQEHGWLTVKPQWYWRNKNADGQFASGPRGTTDTDATGRRIAIAAGSARTPRPDWN